MSVVFGEMLLRIYVTYCSGTKDDTLKGTDKRVTPEKLYTSPRTQGFMNRCKERQVDWAILSDKYGICFPDAKLEWYDKPPNTVKAREFERLRDDFDQKLDKYGEICFYYNPSRFAELYKRLLSKVRLAPRIRKFTHKDEISKEA